MHNYASVYYDIAGGVPGKTPIIGAPARLRPPTVGSTTPTELSVRPHTNVKRRLAPFRQRYRDPVSDVGTPLMRAGWTMTGRPSDVWRVYI